MAPREFWSCTPAEVVLVIRGRGRNVEAHQELLAWHAAWMVNCWTTGDRVTPDQLLGRSNRIDIMNNPQELAALMGGDDG